MKTIIVSFAIIAMALTATAQGFNALAKVTVEKHIEPVTNGPPAMQTRVVDGQTNQFLEYEVLLIEVTEQVTRLQVGSIAVGTNRISQSQGPRPLPSAQRAAAPTKGPTTPHPGPLPVEGRGSARTNAPTVRAPTASNTNSPAYRRQAERRAQATNAPTADSSKRFRANPDGTGPQPAPLEIKK